MKLKNILLALKQETTIALPFPLLREAAGHSA